MLCIQDLAYICALLSGWLAIAFLWVIAIIYSSYSFIPFCSGDKFSESLKCNNPNQEFLLFPVKE